MKFLVFLQLLFLFVFENVLAQPTYRFADSGTKNFIDQKSISIGNTISLDLWLTSVDVPQNTGGAWIDFKSSTSIIAYVSGGRCLDNGSEGRFGPWQSNGGIFINEPIGFGTVLYHVTNLEGAVPDGDGDLIVGTLTLERSTSGDVNVHLTIIPSIRTWTPIQDAEVVPGSLLLNQLRPCTVDDACNDRSFCNGVETCSGGFCQSGTWVDCDDGVGCTIDSCDDVNDQCLNTPNHGICNDGVFCNGAEFCDLENDCSSTGDPCPGETICDENTDQCLGCLVDEDCDDRNECTVDSCVSQACENRPLASETPCDDGMFCTVTDTCQGGFCVGESTPCPQGTFCDEITDQCESGIDTDEDGVFDNQDNCPYRSNGPSLGTCVKELYGVVAGSKFNCLSDDDCGSGETCDSFQGDFNNDTIGDACECYADINNDCRVFLYDFIVIIIEFFTRADCEAGDPCSADLNGDGKVNPHDIAIMANELFRNDCCPE